jgi:hypothetical protein
MTFSELATIVEPTLATGQVGVLFDPEHRRFYQMSLDERPSAHPFGVFTGDLNG